MQRLAHQIDSFAMLFDDPNKFSNEEIRKELTGLGYSAELIDSIIKQFWFHDPYNSFIAIPEHFEILKQFLKGSKPAAFSRFDYYYFFFEKTVPNYKKSRIPLQQLGLYFEQVQKNQMPLSEFTDVLKKINTPTPLTVEYLKGLKLVSISKQDGIETVSWAHHTLTEFLAADYILSQEKPIDEIKKLLVDSQTGDDLLKPSWTGTFRFLIEQNSEYFASWGVEFLSANTDSLIDQVTEMIVFATNSSIKTVLKKALFNLVFGHYQKKKFWIPVWAYSNFFKFIDEAIYKDLKANADDTEYVHKGNIAATIDGMLANNHPLFTDAERAFWKEKLISYAKEENENEVLNRHALAALENFKGQTDIIPQVKKNYSSSDSLVRDAFISMCRAIDPNSPDSIEIFIKAIADDISQIYARHALYSIDTQVGIETFLKNASENPKFIHEFLDNESIFNKKDKQADNELIENIQKNKNITVITLLKKLIISAYTGERNYDAGKSYFLQQVVLIIQSKTPNYLDELIKTIISLPPEKKQILFINDIENILSVLLQPERLEELRKIFRDELHHHAGYALAEAVRLAPYTGNPNGETVLKKGIELGITVDPKTYQKYDDYQKQQDERMYKQFQKYLSPPTKGQYFPQVFRYYLENKEKLEKMWNPEEKKRLLWLADDSNLTKIDPKKIEVHYKDSATKSGEYTITSTAAYFGDVLQVIQILNPALLQTPENRQKVVNFIPFSYLSDFKAIDEILGKITDEELSTLDEIMLNKKNDIRYLIPQTYIYISKTHPDLKSPKKVLLSLIIDPLISESDRAYALENLERHISPSDSDVKELLQKLWKPDTRNQISDLANGLLISVFHDEVAITWRFDTLKSSVTPFRRQEGFHSVGNIEMELDTKSFAKPLINLNDEKYLDRFIDLLNFSLTIVTKPDHREYVNYLWSIVISFVARDEFLLSIEALTALKSWAEQHLGNPEINWLLKRISELSAQNNLVIKIVKSANALAFIKGKKIKWTYPLLREAMKDAGSEQDIDIFISHASAGINASVGENSIVKKINSKLQTKGYKTFLDEEYRTPTIKEKINKYLPKSRFMIVICSERYRKRVCEDGAKEVSTELFHFSEIEEVTKLPLIFPVTYKITRERWKIIGVPELKGNRIQEEAVHDSDGEVDKIVSALLKWIEQNDPETIKKIKK